MATWPLMAHAQQPDGVRRIGVLMGIGDSDPDAKPRVEALEGGLKDLVGRKATISILIIAGRPVTSTERERLQRKSSTSNPR